MQHLGGMFPTGLGWADQVSQSNNVTWSSAKWQSGSNRSVLVCAGVERHRHLFFQTSPPTFGPKWQWNSQGIPAPGWAEGLKVESPVVLLLCRWRDIVSNTPPPLRFSRRFHFFHPVSLVDIGPLAMTPQCKRKSKDTFLPFPYFWRYTCRPEAANLSKFRPPA